MWFGWSVSVWETIFFWVTSIAAVLSPLGLAGAFFSAMISYKIADVVGRNAQVEIAHANARAEEARAEATKAQLELERFRAPRRLNAGQQAALASLAKKTPGTNIFFSVAGGDAEATDLMVQIGNIVRTAGWNWVPCPGSIVTKYPSATPASCQTALFGNVIQSGRRLEGIRDELVSLFNNAEIATNAERALADQNAIHILVGTKPR